MEKRWSTGQLLFWIMVAGIIISVGIQRNDEPRFFERKLSVIAYPFLRIFRILSDSFQRVHEHRTSVKALHKLVADYRTVHEQLCAQIIELHASMAHIHDIEELIRFKKRYTADYMMPAQILMRQFSEVDQSFIIDVGSVRGATVDMVVVYKNCLIGRITKVYPYYSTVMLITDQLAKVPARCLSTGAHGIYEGCGTVHQSRLAYVSHLDKVDVGDIIVSSGDGLIYPKGFGLGRITRCALDEGGFNYAIDVEPLCDVHRVTHCFVLEKGAEYRSDERDAYVYEGMPLEADQASAEDVVMIHVDEASRAEDGARLRSDVADVVIPESDVVDADVPRAEQLMAYAQNGA